MRLSSGIVFEKYDAELFIENEATSVPQNPADVCDKYDYLTAVSCGVMAGCIDIFLVGAPGNSMLGKWTDTQADNFVKFFARRNGWKPRAGNEDNVKSAIGFLEKKFKVNYDQTYSPHVKDMTTKNHHLKNLAHSPSIIGLFFSLLNQFTSTATFVGDGQLITIKTDTFELQGGNIVSKIFCGVFNWLGHIISDMAGSSGAIGRGSGVPIPFYELLQFLYFGKFQIGKHRQDLATLATRVFQEGYDLRFGAAMAIPVVVSELIVRLIWALKRKFYHGLPVKECIPQMKHRSLRIMVIISHGTLCVMDAVDAGIRSGGNALTFALRLNLIAWYRLTRLVLKEVFDRLGIAADTQQYVDSFKAVNEQLRGFIAELEELDIDKYREDADLHEKTAISLAGAEDSETLNIVLIEQTKTLGLAVPWGDESFDEWMENKEKRLIFN